MSRRTIYSPNKAQVVVEGLYKDMERRIEASPIGLCPVDLSRAFLELCYAQTCGKCVPCRIGLGQLRDIIGDVLEGKATMDSLRVLKDTSLSIMETADCAIGYEAAHMVYQGLIGYYDDYETHIMQNRCSFSYKHAVPCVSQCPAQVDIPGYIALVAEGRYEDAIRLIRKDNPFPTTCGFICENPCENRCRRNMVDDAINIRGLKRFAADFAGDVLPPKCANSTGKKVAVLGGGPGGLSAAYYLQLMGHQAVVYEYLPKLGGMLQYGIPNYRLPKDRLNQDIKAILQTGVQVKHGIKVGQDITISQLRDEYDAVLITIGASTDKKMGLEGEENCPNIISAVKFLREPESHNLTGQNVVVVGGGNVSMDAVRSAIRLGAKKVNILYRRRIADMTALPAEIEGAISEGVELITLKTPSKLKISPQGKLEGIYATPQMISKIKEGKATVKPTGEEDILIPCDTIIVAIGQAIDSKHFEDSGVPSNKGVIKTEIDGGFDSIPGVFAGGDCTTGPSTVIRAIAAAKVTAANIDEYLGYHHIISSDVEIPSAKLVDYYPCGRVGQGERKSSERIHDFEAVELCMSPIEAKQESSRCLRCDHFGYGIFKGGRETKW